MEVIKDVVIKKKAMCKVCGVKHGATRPEHLHPSGWVNWKKP